MSPIVFIAVNKKPDSEIMHYYRDQDLLLDLLITTSAPSAGSDSVSAPEHTETGSTKPEVVIPSSAFIKPVVLSEHGTSTPASTCGFMSVYAASTSSTRSLNKRDTDAMTGMIGDPSKSVEFSGSSSAASFMRQINAAIDARLGSSGSNHSSTYPSRTTSSPTDSKVSIDPLAYTLPQRSFADSLVQDYYDLVWVILPVHDWTIFRKAYQSIWLSCSSTIPEHILYCMVNLTFALGSQFSQAVPPTAHEAIDILHQNLDLETVTGPVPAWWFAVLFVYTAATVLLAKRLRPKSYDASLFEPWPIPTGWNQAIELLKAYARVGESAERCVAALEILASRIMDKSRVEEDLNGQQSLEETHQSIIVQNPAGELLGFRGPSINFDFNGMDFDINDMFWLNSSAADILF
ncbi:hypothetical protein FOCG_03545 [Fusarium oxysporum f. sp. radicis-lycopersici 26381]|nr:hypothetical protein FOCG_03545 [Fusarium oxysporum f. sp. radicis-lycopersici 26381]